MTEQEQEQKLFNALDILYHEKVITYDESGCLADWISEGIISCRVGMHPFYSLQPFILEARSALLIDPLLSKGFITNDEANKIAERIMTDSDQANKIAKRLAALV